VSLSVSAPSAFTPSESALGAVPGQAMVVFTFVLTNGSDAALDPMVFPTASSGGTEAELIYDSGNALGIVSNGPTTSLLPGQVVQWYVAFSVVDVNDITLEASPSFAHQNVIFTNVAF